jgi:hypothetical protein
MISGLAPSWTNKNLRTVMAAYGVSEEAMAEARWATSEDISGTFIEVAHDSVKDLQADAKTFGNFLLTELRPLSADERTSASALALSPDPTVERNSHAIKVVMLEAIANKAVGKHQPEASQAERIALCAPAEAPAPGNPFSKSAPDKASSQQGNSSKKNSSKKSSKKKGSGKKAPAGKSTPKKKVQDWTNVAGSSSAPKPIEHDQVQIISRNQYTQLENDDNDSEQDEHKTLKNKTPEQIEALRKKRERQKEKKKKDKEGKKNASSSLSSSLSSPSSSSSSSSSSSWSSAG